MDPGADEPEQRPAADFFSADAPHDGDVVPSGPVGAAICPFALGGHSVSGGPVHLTGSSLSSLVKELNAADRYDGTENCTAQAGWQGRIVFRYADDRILPVVVSSSGCGYADNGAQQRIGLGPWLETWKQKLDRRVSRGS
jgi:hypothetical protein